MNINNRKKYDRVMSRIIDQSADKIKVPFQVVRHGIASSHLGAKPSDSNVSSGVFSELPIVLNDLKHDTSPNKLVKRKHLVKPRKTIKSLDPALSPHRSPSQKEPCKKARNNITAGSSAPAVLASNLQKWSSNHFKDCLSSRSNSKLKELQAEIKAYDEKEKVMRLKSNLYKKCGVVLDGVGQVAEDKAVQVQDVPTQETGIEVVELWVDTQHNMVIS